MSNYFIDPTVSARVQETLVLVNDRNKESSRENQYSPAERGRRYPDYGKRMLVELENTPHHAEVTLKMALPISVGEHNIGSAVRAMLVGSMDDPAKVRLNAQCVEVVPAHFKDPGARWILPGVQRHLTDAISCHSIKTAVAIAQIEIIGIRLTRVLVAGALDYVQALRLWHIQRAQNQSIHYAKDHGVCADRHRQCQHRDGRESGILLQHANRVP